MTAPRDRQLEAAFAALYQRWYGDVARWVRVLGAREADADDVTQEVFLVAHRRLAQFDGQNPGAWLYQIVRRKVRDHRRLLWIQRFFSTRGVSLTQANLVTDSDPLDELEHKRAREHLAVLLDELSADQRDAFLLFHIEGRTGERIADLVGVSVNTVWARLFKARRNLQFGFQRWGSMPRRAPRSRQRAT